MQPSVGPARAGPSLPRSLHTYVGATSTPPAHSAVLECGGWCQGKVPRTPLQAPRGVGAAFSEPLLSLFARRSPLALASAQTHSFWTSACLDGLKRPLPFDLGKGSLVVKTQYLPLLIKLLQQKTLISVPSPCFEPSPHCSFHLLRQLWSPLA